MSKGEEEKATVRRGSNKRKDPIRQTEEVYCHQCQRGRLLEILSLMEKEAAKTETGKESSIAARCREGRAAETGSFKEEAAKGE